MAGNEPPEEVVWRVEGPLAEVEFLELGDLPVQERARLQRCVAALPGVAAPGSEARVWQTPRQEPPPSIDLAFGSATAVFDSLQHGAGGPSFEAPEAAPPPSLPTYLPTGMPVASPAQHIHINNFTANLNFPPHPSPPTAAPQSLPPQQQQQALQQQQQPQSLHSQPLPFTIGSHFPPGTQYVAPFPQPPAPAQYQGPPVVVYQPQFAMFTPPPGHQQGQPGQVHGVANQHQQPAYHTPTPPPATTAMVREGGGIMFGSTPVVSVRHSSSDEEEEQRSAHMQHQKVEEQKPTEKQQEETLARPQPSAARNPPPADHVNFSPGHHSSAPGHVVKPSPGAVKASSGKVNPGSGQQLNPAPASGGDGQQQVNAAAAGAAASKPVHHIQADNTLTEAPTDASNQSATDSTSKAAREAAPTPPPSKSWASLFTPAPGSGSSTPPTSKPTARIPPFSPHCSDPSTSAQASEASEEELRLSAFLRNYQLNHMAPSFLPRGLTNRSNWCFVNAILQALLACPPFYNLMKALPSKIQQSNATTTKSTTPMIDSVVEFINEFTPLEMMNKNQKKDKARKKEDLPTGNALEPSYVYRTLLQLESETFKVVEGRQEDAEEFLTCMLNMISDEMSSLLKLTEVQQGQEGGGEESSEGGPEWQEVTARGRSCITRRVADESSLDTPVRQLALGLCRYSVKAEGGETSATLQPFFTLQLDIQHEMVGSVEEALLQNFASEQLDGYICSKTRLEVEASRNLSLEDLPPILVLHLKRFVYDGTTGGCQKVMKAVDFSVDLEIPRDILSIASKNKYTTKQRQYKLFGVVYHNGREATKGHYVADVYHTGYASWLHCDDSIVKPTAEQLVVQPSQNSVPYILFYRRGDTMVGVEKTVK